MALSGIHTFPKLYLASIMYPEIVPGAQETLVSKKRCGPYPHGASGLLLDESEVMPVDENFQLIMKTCKLNTQYREGSTRRQGTEKQVEPDLSGPSSHVKDVDLVLWAKESHLRQSGSDISHLHLQSIILSTGRRMDGRGDIPHRILGLLPQSTGTAQAHHQITLCSFSLKPLSLMHIFPLFNFLFFSIPAYSCGWM